VVADEDKWNKAKEIVHKEYGKTESDGDHYWELVMGVYKKAGGTIKKSEPELLIDIVKGKGNRDGLIQQIVTYVRDGHTVTRKQWVRSEFADHAKKDEEEKKEVMLREKKREEHKRERKLKEEQDKQDTRDARAYKRAKANQEKEEHHGRQHKITQKQVQQLKHEIELKNKDKGKDDKKDDKRDDKKKKTKSAYDQKNETKADNRRQLDIM